jgi:hypothetical protein
VLKRPLRPPTEVCGCSRRGDEPSIMRLASGLEAGPGPEEGMDGAGTASRKLGRTNRAQRQTCRGAPARRSRTFATSLPNLSGCDPLRQDLR